MTYDNTNSGMMMRNDRRQSDSHPEFTGSINVAGVDYWISAWVNTGKAGSKIDGRKYFSIKLSPKDAPKVAPKAQYMTFDAADDDLPF